MSRACKKPEEKSFTDWILLWGWDWICFNMFQYVQSYSRNGFGFSGTKRPKSMELVFDSMKTASKSISNPWMLHFFIRNGFLHGLNSIQILYMFIYFNQTGDPQTESFHQKPILLVPRSTINSRVFMSHWNIHVEIREGNPPPQIDDESMWSESSDRVCCICHVPFWVFLLSGPVVFSLFWGQKSYPVLWGVFHKPQI